MKDYVSYCRFSGVWLKIAVIIALALAAAVQSRSQSATIQGLLAVFDEFDVVALSEGGHQNDIASDFRVELIHHPEFANVVDDIVVEFANSRYQDILDRYMEGGDVPLGELRKVWRDTTQYKVWDSPVYAEFFEAVRTVNQNLTEERRIRVLAGDPPIDWSKIRTVEDWAPWVSTRDDHFALVVEREVLSRDRKALLIAGGAHFDKKNQGGVAALLNTSHPGSLFVVTTVKGPGSRCGPGDRSDEWSFSRLSGKTDGGPAEADGCLYLGSEVGDKVDPDPTIYDRTAYGREMERRRTIFQAAMEMSKEDRARLRERARRSQKR